VDCSPPQEFDYLYEHNFTESRFKNKDSGNLWHQEVGKNGGMWEQGDGKKRAKRR
jgi:hypothetical protein